MNVCGALVSLPPLAVPPLSTARTVTVAPPSASRVGVYVSVPSGAIAGWTAKSPGLLLETVKVTLSEASSAGPGVIPVAQPGTV